MGGEIRLAAAVIRIYGEREAERTRGTDKIHLLMYVIRCLPLEPQGVPENNTALVFCLKDTIFIAPGQLK